MNTKIICCDMGKKIIFNEGICLTIEEEDGVKKIYYNIDHEPIEVIQINKESLNAVNKYIGKNDKVIILLENINSEYGDFFEENLTNNNKMFIVSSKSSLKHSEYIENRKKVVCLAQLMMEEERININSLLMIIKNRGLLNDNSYLILGDIDEKSSVSEIALFILRRFKYMQNLKKFTLYIFSNNTLGIEELSYVSDPLLEYLPEKTMLEIRQLEQKQFMNKKYFSLVCN